MKDLFGVDIEVGKENKSREADYTKYINSTKWKKIRAEKIKRSGGKCERCGISKWSAKLEVHHKHYENFKNERLTDLEVLCDKCHKKADEKRKLEVRQRNYEIYYDARFEGWARKVYGEYWYNEKDVDLMRDEFDDWLDRKDDY